MTRQHAAVSRRRFLGASAVAMLGVELVADRAEASALSLTGRPSTSVAGSVKALVFDTFGTVVDWRASVTQEVAQLAMRKGLRVDAEKFADAWRAGYAPSMNRVRTGEFIIAPLSNGSISLMTDPAKHSGLPWDCILGAELVRHYKPDREVYQSAPDILDLKVDEVMMVAAHLGDLRAAKGVGLRTAFVARPLEFGPQGKPDLHPDASVDVAAKDFNDLAGQLGV